MKGLLVAVIVLAVALAVVTLAFVAAALAVVRKLRRIRATRDSQFLLRGDSAGAERTLLGTASTVEDEGKRDGSGDQPATGRRQARSDEPTEDPGVAPLTGLRGATLSRRGSGVSASSWELKALGDYHQHLLKMRLEGGLEGIEMGPILGRGSFGRGYKGRWQGALVAIKIVEHSLKGAAAEIEGARESLLAASISHPNVVACYKICTVRLNLPQGASSDADTDEADVAAVSLPPSERGSAKAGIGVGAFSALDLQRKRSLERLRANQRAAAAASPPPVRLERLTSAERHEILAVSPAGGSVSPFGASGVPGSRRPSTLPTVPSEENEAAPHVALDIRPDGGTAGEQHRRGPSDAITEASEAAGDPDLALELEVLRSEELAAGGDEDQAVIETWMLLEYADRGSLEQAISARRFVRKADQSLDMGSVYRTLMDIATGMHYLHCLAIVHGDLKPANVLLKSTVTDARGFVCKLADFGLSRVLDLNSTHLSTQSFGTVPYMPPELLSQGRMTKAVDVYSFGMLMWQLFVGQPPFNGLQMGQVLYGVVHCCARPELPPDMPPAYAALIEGCWSADPELRPAFQAIIEALHQQMQQHLAAEKAAAAAASAAAAKRVSPFGAMSNLMKMKNKSSSSDSEGTRAAAAAAVASRSLSGTSRDATAQLLPRPGAAAEAASSAALADKGRQLPGGGSITSQGSVALSPAKSSGLLAIPQPGASMVAGVTATISQSPSPKSSASMGGRSASSGSSGHLPAGLFRRSGSAAEAAGSPRRLLQPVAALAARLRRGHQSPSDDDVTTGSLSEPSLQKLVPANQGYTAFSRGSLPANILGQAMQGVQQPGLGASGSAIDPPPWQGAPSASAQRPAAEVNRSCSAPLRRPETAAQAAARRAFSAPDAVAKLAADLRAGSLVGFAGPALSGGPPPQHASCAPSSAGAAPSQPPAQTSARPPSPFAVGLYAPPPPPLGAAMPAGGVQPGPRSRSAMAMAAEVVAANAVLADRARAKQAYATADRAQADEGMAGRAGRVPTVMEAATAASTAASFGLSRYTNGDKAATAAVNAAASAVRHDAAAGSVLFLQQRYLESVQTQATDARPSSEVTQAIAAAAGSRRSESSDRFTRLIRTHDEAGGPLRYSVEWRRSSGPELLPIALRGAIRSRRKSTDTRPAGFLGAQQGEEPLHISRSAGDGEGAGQGLLASAAAAAVRSVVPRSRSSPESSHSGDSSDGGAADDATRALVGRIVSGRVLEAGPGSSSAVSSFMLAPSRLTAAPPAVTPTGPTLPYRGPVQAAPGAEALIELSNRAAVDQAEPPGRLPVAALHAQQPHRQLPPLSPAFSPQLYRNASSSSASVDSRGSMRSAASLASSTSVRSGPAHPQRPPPAAASAGWAGIRESLDVSGIDATVGEEVTAESSVRIASEPDGRPGIAPSTFASQPSASSSGQPSRVVGQELTHQFEPPHSEAGSAPPRQTFAEAADAAVAAVEAEAT